MISELMPIKVVHEKGKGFISFLESTRDIPFEIKRIYYISDVPCGEARGFHAHKALKQFLFCPFGKVNIELDDGREKKEVLLDTPEKGLYLSPDTWHKMVFITPKSILLVVASDYYNESDYIRDYDEFIKMVNEGFWNEC